MGVDLGAIYTEIAVDIKKLDAGLMQAQTHLAAADKTITGYGQKLTNSSTKMMMAGGLMVGAVAGVAIAAVDMASKFDTSMRNVNSISKLSETQFQALGKSVVDMSKKFPQTAKELADGLYDIASSGFQGADGLKILEASAKAASAGLTTTAVSAKGITAVINAYGLEAEDAAGISDTMFKTVDRGVISFEELSSTVGDWIGLAKIAGISFNEASGAIAYMTTKGIGASEAGTALQRLMLSIITPTDEMAAAIKNAGYESGEAMLKQIGLTGSMDFLNKATGGSVSALTKLIPRIEGVKGANALLGSGYEDLTKFMNDFKDTTGATDIALKEQSKSLSFQLDILKNNGTALGIELGNKLIPPIADLVKKLNELSPATKDNIYNFAEMSLKVIAAGGGVLLLAGAFGKLRAIMLANPIMAVVAGFVALNGAVDLGSGKLESYNNVWADFGSLALQSLTPLVAVKQSVTDVTTIISAYRDGIIKLSDAHYVNLFAMDDEIKKINALRAEKEADLTATVNLANSTFNYTDALAASTTTMDANKTSMEESTGATDANTAANEADAKSVDDLRGEYNKLIGVLFDSINTSNAFQEADWALTDAQNAVTEAVKKYGVGSREAETAINGLDGASQTYIDTAYGVYTAVYATKDEQDKAKQSAIEYGLQLVSSGKIGEGAFISMASQFGLKSGDIIAYADAMGIKLDYATRMRILELDTDGATRSANEFQQALDNLHDKTINITTYYRSIGLGMEAASNAAAHKSMGGIVGYANGGTVGMPQAATGMIVPQTGRAYPIIAHEYEDILNTSQQKNIAEWIMGKANSRPDSKSSSSNEVILHTIINLDGKVLWESNEKYDIRAAGVRV